MLKANDFHEAIDEASRRLVAIHPDQLGSIASLGANMHYLMKRLVGSGGGNGGNGNGGMEDISELFDICTSINTSPEWDLEPEIAESVEKERFKVFVELVALFYERKVEKDMDHQMEYREERSMVLKIARWLPEFRKNPPAGMIGPEWLEENLPEDFWWEIVWFVYDIEQDEMNWSRFSSILPKDVKQKFDEELTPMDLPLKIESNEDWLRIATQVYKRLGYPSLGAFLEPLEMEKHYARSRAVQLLWDYGMQILVEKDPKSAFQEEN
ncbi:MAG: hypothetical protein CMI55_02890 [Parcubacteria group bacterium]|jgi:hypothetical protein|nr:hypothetical protein [Parcubacteria group bacterium]|tara:strand:+ start:131 stop:934 length:804 start_codon:yes stop_codon:yes gene_type:complete